jgi:EmrB/QacA subfamily drug resistance transporter
MKARPNGQQPANRAPTAVRREPTHHRAVLPVILLSLAVVVSAVPALNVALPSLAADTGATMSQLQWIVDAYALVFAALLLPAGAIGDRYGRKPVLVWGLAVFALGAAGAAMTSAPDMLIAWRSLMGLGAALVMPSTLSIITTSLPGERRSKAVAAWVGVAGAGAIVGLVAAGLLLERWGWASVFWLYAGVAVVICLAASRLIPNSVEPDPPRVDYVGGLLSVLTLTSIVYGAIEGPERGWGSPETLGAFAFGGVALVAWLVWSLKVAEPLLDPRLFARRGFSTGVVSISLQFFVFFGFVFVIIQYLQLVLDYSPLQAGLALLPMGMAIGAVSRRVPHLVEKAGRRPLALAGLLMMATAMTLLSTLDEGSSYWLVLAGIVPVGVGMALAMAPATTDIVAAVPLHKQGVASATNDAAREVGGTLGIAVLGSVLNDQYRAGVAAAAPDSAPDGLVDTAQESLGAALGIAARLGERGDALGEGARTAFVDGLAVAFLGSASLLVLCAVVFAVVIPRRGKPEQLPPAVPDTMHERPNRPREPVSSVSSTTFRTGSSFQPWVMFLR